MSTDNKPKTGTYSAGSLRSNKFVKRKYFNINEDQSNIYRLLPPFGALALTNPPKISAYHQVFFLQGASGRKRPVVSLFQKGRDGQIVKRCPIVDKIEALTLQLNAISNDPNYDQNLVKAKREQLAGLRMKKANYVNVMDQAGDIGVLAVPYTAFQSLKKRLDELEAEGIDPINAGPDKGIFFDFQRYKNDQGRVTYEVEVSTLTRKDPTTGRPVKEYNWAPIDDQVLKRMETEAADLLNMYKPLSSQEMELLATLDPKVIDQVFARPEEAQPEQFEAEEFEDAPPLTAQTFTPPTAPSRPLPPPTQYQGTVVSDVNPPAQPVVTRQPTPAPQPAAARPAQPTPPPTVVQGNDLVSQFLKR
jgi:hypothetical protein